MQTKQEYWLEVAKKELQQGRNINKVKKIIGLCTDRKLTDSIVEYIKK